MEYSQSCHGAEAVNIGELVKSIEQTEQLIEDYYLPSIVEVKSDKNCAAHLRVAERQEHDTSRRKTTGIAKNIKCVITATCGHNAILEAWPLKVHVCWRAIAVLFLSFIVRLTRYPELFSYDVACRFWAAFFSVEFAEVARHIIAVLPALHIKSPNFKYNTSDSVSDKSFISSCAALFEFFF